MAAGTATGDQGVALVRNLDQARAREILCSAAQTDAMRDPRKISFARPYSEDGASPMGMADGYAEPANRPSPDALFDMDRSPVPSTQTDSPTECTIHGHGTTSTTPHGLILGDFRQQ